MSNWRTFQIAETEWISPAVNEGTNLSISLPVLVFICLLLTLENVKKNLDLMCIYLRTNDIELLFISLLAICMFYLGTWLFKTHCPYVNWVVFLLLSFKKYYLDTCPYQYIVWKYFPHSVSCLFTFWWCSLKDIIFFFNFDEAHFIYIFFKCLYFWSHS